MTLDQIKYFVEITRSGSFNKAAQRLMVTQPNISLMVKSLETELNYKLFIRNTTGIELTRHGAEFLYYAENILKSLDKIDTIQPIEIEEDKTRLCVSSHFVASSIFPLVSLIKSTGNKNYTYKLYQKSFFDVVEDVKMGDSDMGLITISKMQETLMYNLLAKNNLKFHSISAVDVTVLLSKTHPLANHKSLNFEDLNHYTQVHFDIGQKEFYSAHAIKEMQYDQFDRRVSVTDFFHLLYTLEKTNAFALSTNMSFYNIEQLLKTINISLRCIPFDKKVQFDMGYIERIDSSQSDEKKAYIAQLKKLIF
ncbi:LysR family transcriptional regulator [Fusibacter ferrireducens]|uniref:LysR family transcriptional regulator n=1 Tax=Fusibacter ferrireducens TaxID=2785058 RepID=A0ABR9ZP21_9FIRM|nr:LysR family transcriptional regulator [Fusibacter ferrireducens]MBF4692218.1 LysR family transcriptional regulator [Fusibacter ferrireducens]